MVKCISGMYERTLSEHFSSCLGIQRFRGNDISGRLLRGIAWSLTLPSLVQQCTHSIPEAEEVPSRRIPLPLYDPDHGQSSVPGWAMLPVDLTHPSFEPVPPDSLSNTLFHDEAGLPRFRRQREERQSMTSSAGPLFHNPPDGIPASDFFFPGKPKGLHVFLSRRRMSTFSPVPDSPAPLFYLVADS